VSTREQLDETPVVQEEGVQRRHRSRAVAEVLEQSFGTSELAGSQEGQAFVVVTKQSHDPAPACSEAQEYRRVQREHCPPNDPGAE
jgi:hypothetical protein